jgi:hypothetical protein
MASARNTNISRRRQGFNTVVVKPSPGQNDISFPHIHLAPNPYSDGAIATGAAGDISWLDSGSDALLTARDESRHNLLTHNLYLTVPVVATSVDTFIFHAIGHAIEVVGIDYLSTVAGSDGGAVTADVRKITDDTSAPGAAAGAAVVELLQSALSLKTTANAVAAGTLVTTAGVTTVAAGQKLAVNFTGTMTAAVGTLVVAYRPIVAYTES